MLTKKSSQKRTSNKALYESIMRDVSKVVKKHLNEMTSPIAVKYQLLFDNLEQENYLDNKNISTKQRILLNYILNEPTREYGEPVYILLLRGSAAYDDRLLPEEIIDYLDENGISVTDQIGENEIGLLVFYENFNFVWFNTSYINRRNEQETWVYSYHDMNNPDVNSLVITKDPEGDITDAAEYEEELIH